MYYPENLIPDSIDPNEKIGGRKLGNWITDLIRNWAIGLLSRGVETSWQDGGVRPDGSYFNEMGIGSGLGDNQQTVSVLHNKEGKFPDTITVTVQNGPTRFKAMTQRQPSGEFGRPEVENLSRKK